MKKKRNSCSYIEKRPCMLYNVSTRLIFLLHSITDSTKSFDCSSSPCNLHVRLSLDTCHWTDKCNCHLWLFNSLDHQSSSLSCSHKMTEWWQDVVSGQDLDGHERQHCRTLRRICTTLVSSPLTDLIPLHEKTDWHSFSLTFHTHSHMCTHTGH